MTTGFTKAKKLICCVLLFLSLGIAAITGMGNASDHASGVTVAHAACDGVNPQPNPDCVPQPTATPTPGND